MSPSSHRAEPPRRIAPKPERGARRAGKRARSSDGAVDQLESARFPEDWERPLDAATSSVSQQTRVEPGLQASPDTQWALEALSVPLFSTPRPKRRRDDVVYDEVAPVTVPRAAPAAPDPAPAPRLIARPVEEQPESASRSRAPSFATPAAKKPVTGIRTDSTAIWIGVAAVVLVAILIVVIQRASGGGTVKDAQGPGKNGALDSLSAHPGIAMILPDKLPDGYRWQGQSTYAVTNGVTSSRTSLFVPKNDGSPRVEVCVESAANQCLRGEKEIVRTLGSLDVRINLDGTKGLSDATRFWQHVSLNDDLSSGWLAGK